MENLNFSVPDNLPSSPDRPRSRVTKKFIDAIFTSKRVGASIVAVLVIVLGQYGMDESLALVIQATLVSWVVSDSIRPTENVFTSRRFWLVVASIAASTAATYGISIDPEKLVAIILPVIAWILGDGIRETLSGASKDLQRRMRMR